MNERNAYLSKDGVQRLQAKFTDYAAIEQQVAAAYGAKLGTAITINLGPALDVIVDPLNTREIRWQGRVVGYINQIRNKGDQLIADAVITDEEARKQMTT